MKGIVFVQAKDRTGRHDATGAFLPGARRFAAKYGLPAPVLLDETTHHRKDARASFLTGLQRSSGLEVIAYFGHGVEPSAHQRAEGLASAGIWGSDLPRFASLIRQAAAPACRVIFYACSVGTPGGFAEKLARMLPNTIKVYGHSIAGHACTNPFVTRYPYMPEDTQPFVVPVHSPLWSRWHHAMKAEHSDFWLRMPFMTRAQVEASV
jgi:hypothetical protein